MLKNVLLHKLNVYSGNPAVICDNKTITYKELYHYSSQLSEQLHSLGIQKGRKVILLIPNSIEFVTAFFALTLLDAVIIPLYTHITAEKLTEICSFYTIDTVITIDSIYKKLDETVLKESKSINHLFIINNEYHLEKRISVDRPYELLMNQGVAMIFFSSGTTNIPKAVMLTWKNIECNLKGITEYLKVNSKDRVLLIKNINHVSSIIGELLVALYNGASVYMTTRIVTPSLIQEMIYSCNITIFFAIPAILLALITHKNFNSSYYSSLQSINFYGAPVDPDKAITIIDKLNKVNIIYSYGLTEAAPRVTYIYKEDLKNKPGSSGIPIQGVELFIMDEEGNQCRPGEIGEIAVRGPNVMAGYLNNPELTSITLRNGLLFTRDCGYKDSEGFLYVTGRKDNMIIYAGKNIYPEEIEGVITRFSGIKEVLVRGEKCDVYGCKIIAYIVPDETLPFSKETLLNHCKKYLEDYKIPRDVRIVHELEKTHSGKIKRGQ